MEITCRQQKNTVYVSIAGVLDNHRDEELKKELLSLFSREFSEAVFNLSNVTAMTSSAIGRLVMFYREAVQCGRTMRIEGVHDNLFVLFKSINLQNFFRIDR